MRVTTTGLPNTPPTLVYGDAFVPVGGSSTNSPTTATDNSSIAGYAIQSQGTYTGTISVDASGVVSFSGAMPPGAHLITIRATDDCGATTDASFTVTVGCPTIIFSPGSLPGATVNVAYSQAITATPAGGNYSFALTSGLLSAGLTLNSNGSFSGAPTQSGTFNFRVTASGVGGCTGFRDYVLVVACPTIALTPASLPGGTIGTAYNQTAAGSPAGTYSYAVTSGALPTGLALNTSTGAITGTPTTGGSFSFTITATAGACSDSQSYTNTIACPAISFTTSSPLPAGQAGVAYSQTLTVSPAGSYTFSLTAGNLPPGLSLTPLTGAISGTPSVAGTYTFTAKAQTAAGCI